MEDNSDVNQQQNQWRCTSCGVRNPISRRECKKSGCTQWRPKSAMPRRRCTWRSCEPSTCPWEGDWRCCGQMQFASRHSCRRCGKEKPAAVAAAAAKVPRNGKRARIEQVHGGGGGGVLESVSKALITFRKGDWLCDKCKDHQFAKNAFCRQCGQSRPAREDDDGNDIDDPCAICFSSIKNAGFLHEMNVHVLSCKECADKLVAAGGKCPMCRKEIEAVLKVFF